MNKQKQLAANTKQSQEGKNFGIQKENKKLKRANSYGNDMKIEGGNDVSEIISDLDKEYQECKQMPQFYQNRHQEHDEDDLVQRSSILSFRDDDKDQDKSRDKYPKSKLLAACENEDSQIVGSTALRNQLRNLRIAIAELYIGIKQKTKDESEQTSAEEEKEERELIMALDSYMIIEYIKSSVDIILNLKFEEIEKRLVDKNNNASNEHNSVSSSQIVDKRRQLRESGKHQQPSTRENETERSNFSVTEGPPKIYEELIQSLEADIRKHIRIEQQLKLHIESMENRIEELENDLEKKDGENVQIKKSNTQKSKEIESRVKELEELVISKDSILKQHESSIKAMKDSEAKFRKEIEQLKAQLVEHQNHMQIDQFQNILNQAIDVSRTQDLNSSGNMNKTQPMIIKQSNVTMGGDALNVQQIRKINLQSQGSRMEQFGSYSSNHSFIDPMSGSSPDRRATPDITHPYLHHTTQIITKKKTITPGTGVKNKKFIPNSVVESLGVQPSFNPALHTYSSTAAQGPSKIIGQRKLSSQASRNNPNIKGLKTVSKNSWMSHNGGNSLLQQQPQFSNIINNNIQGLSINYSNQIIQPSVDPIQQFANNFIALPQAAGLTKLQSNNNQHSDDSDSSNPNSHRRCKSQNVKRDRSETNGSSLAKKSIDRQKIVKQQQQPFFMHTDLSQDDIIMRQIANNESFQTKSSYDKHKFRSMAPHGSLAGPAATNMMEETANFKQQNVGNFMNESTRLNGEVFQDINRRTVKQHGQSITSHTLSGQTTQKVRNSSNRANGGQSEELGKNRFNQSYGGSAAGQASLIQQKKQSAHNSIAGGGIVIHSRNGNIIGNINSTSQSIEKVHRSRNKSKQQQQLSHNQTVMSNQPQYPISKFDGSVLDINFKTTTTNSNNQSKNATVVNAGGSFQITQKAANSATNTSAFINQANVHMIKQQIMAQKKASNLLMKGLSPLKNKQ